MPGHWSQTMGGSQYQARCIIEELKKSGRYDIYYLTRHYDPSCSDNGYKLVPYSYPGGQTQGSHRHFFEMVILPGILKKIRPDIIYQRVGCAQTGIAAQYAMKHRCKMVWHVASQFDVQPPRIHFSRKFLYQRLQRYLLNYGIRHATHIIAQTEDQNRLLRRNFNRSATAVIPNLHPAPKEPLDKSGVIKIVWVANLKSIKQPDIYIRLANELQDLPHVQFIMIGAIQGSPKTKKKYRELIDQSPSLKYLGAQNQETVNKILAQSHIFVCTSMSEGFPNTFIQAWMRQVPVVSLKVDPDRLIRRHSLGFVSDSFEKLKESVTTLATQEDLRYRQGLNAQVFSQQYFSLRNVQKIAQVFDSRP
jgi:glycosyltransferase involved in cell wall biosynthesis